jgi:hypothetical protein
MEYTGSNAGNGASYDGSGDYFSFRSGDLVTGPDIMTIDAITGAVTFNYNVNFKGSANSSSLWSASGNNISYIDGKVGTGTKGPNNGVGSYR